ncbi:MAG: hypothetical protein IPP87_05260 [Ideonella sp.]|nr:hypothetical protein [Ideonella sp.]
MPLFRRLHRRLSWIALFAMLAMALAPTVSHALADAPAPWLSEICSAKGSTSPPTGGTGEPASCRWVTRHLSTIAHSVASRPRRLPPIPPWRVGPWTCAGHARTLRAGAPPHLRVVRGAARAPPPLS